jgi:ABC-type amino acid transport system permease subunit
MLRIMKQKMISISLLRVVWALVGVPLFVALFTYFGIFFIGESPSTVPIFVWLIVFVLAIASGLRELLSVLPQNSLLRIVVSVAYVAAAYPGVIGLSFVGACAHGCG